MTDYFKIKSKFVKDKLKNLEFDKKNERYIYDLMYIERFAKNEVTGGGIGKGVIKHVLKSKYQKEWLAIFKELNPEMYEVYKETFYKEKREQTNITKERRARERKEEDKSKKSWNFIKNT